MKWDTLGNTSLARFSFFGIFTAVWKVETWYHRCQGIVNEVLNQPILGDKLIGYGFGLKTQPAVDSTLPQSPGAKLNVNFWHSCYPASNPNM